MPFDFDTSNPTDTYLIPSFPANERLHRTAVYDMVEIEHDSAEGRHKFGVGNDATRDGITTWVVGSIWFNTGESPAYLQRVASVGPVVWENVDSRASVAHYDEQTDYTVSQFASYDQVTPVSATPDTLAIDLSLSPFKYATLVGNTIISNPINLLSGGSKGVSVVLDLTMDGTGGHTITWDTEYYSSLGVAPPIDTSANARNMLAITKLQDAKYVVTTAQGIAVIT